MAKLLHLPVVLVVDASAMARSVSGTQIHRSCCSGVFVDQSAEPVASVELVWWVRTDEA
jgi:hypothetical protein